VVSRVQPDNRSSDVALPYTDIGLLRDLNATMIGASHGDKANLTSAVTHCNCGVITVGPCILLI
jgi:hypothetical protein